MKHIYVFSTPTYEQNGYYKIGETTRRVSERVREWDKRRLKQTCEAFTPTQMAMDMIKQLGPGVKDAKMLEPSCGDGQLVLAALLTKVMMYGQDPITALKQVYGVELMPDNAKICRHRMQAM